MELFLNNPGDLDLREFIENIVIPKLKNNLLDILDERYLIPIEDYINSPVILNRLKVDPAENIHINLKTALIVAINTLKILRIGNNYSLSINSNETIPKITAKLIDIISLIEYGSTGSPAYPVIEETFKLTAPQLNDLYEEYINGT